MGKNHQEPYPFAVHDIVAYVHQLIAPATRAYIDEGLIAALAAQLGLHQIDSKSQTTEWCRAASRNKGAQAGTHTYSLAARDALRFNVTTALRMGWDLTLPHYPFQTLLSDLACLTAESQADHQTSSLHEGMSHTYLSHES